MEEVCKAMAIDICDMHKNCAGRDFEKSVNRITDRAFGNVESLLFNFLN